MKNKTLENLSATGTQSWTMRLGAYGAPPMPVTGWEEAR